MQSQTHYTTLHVDQCATGAEIKSAFRTLAQRFHPDVTKDSDGERKFKDVADAYRTLKSHDSKVAYDHQINNTCADQAALAKNLAGIGDFNWGVVLFQYYLWFWLHRDRNSE